MAFSLPADLPTNWADNVGMIENAAYLNSVGALNNAEKAALLGMVNNTAGAVVAASETTNSTTYTDLTTTTDSVTVTIGASGMALVLIYANITSTGHAGVMSYAVSGANTIAATDAKSVSFWAASNPMSANIGGTFLETGLAAGATTFKLKYKTTYTETQTFANRRIAVIPFF